MWADWLHHQMPFGGPQRIRAGNEIRSGTHVRRLALTTLPSGGLGTLRSGVQNQKLPTCGWIGYITPSVSGFLIASEAGTNQKWPTIGRIGYITPTV